MSPGQNTFSGSEIVEIGIQIEKNGRDFYKTLVKYSENQKGKDIFKYLAREEERHIAAFQKILDSVQKYDPKESYPREYFAYMNALASDFVFTQEDKGVEIAKNVNSTHEAIELGIGFEKDSIIFYNKMKKVVPEDDHEVIDELIEQEYNHLNQLYDLRGSLN